MHAAGRQSSIVCEPNRDRLVRTFVDLVQINSPSFQERALGRFLEKRFRELGCSVEFQEYGESFNLFVFRQGQRKRGLPLILSAHMDTVEPTEGIRIQVDDEAVRSAGETVLGADDKSAIAQILEALAVISENDIPCGDLEMVFTSAEEKGLQGSRKLDFSRLRGREAIVLDSGGSVGRIVTAAPTHHTYVMTITGKAAHAGIEPEKGISAIRVASEIIAAAPEGKIDGMTTANIGVISGGTATNVVPREVVLKGEFRSHDEEKLSRMKEDFFNAARSICERRSARFSVAVAEEYKRFTVAGDDPFMKFIRDEFVRCGVEPVLEISCGGSDANIFNANGIMTVNIATGMRDVHSPREHIFIRDLVDGARFVLSAVAAYPPA